MANDRELDVLTDLIKENTKSMKELTDSVNRSLYSLGERVARIEERYLNILENHNDLASRLSYLKEESDASDKKIKEKVELLNRRTETIEKRWTSMTGGWKLLGIVGSVFAIIAGTIAYFVQIYLSHFYNK